MKETLALPAVTLTLSESLAPRVIPNVKNAVSLLTTVASDTIIVLLDLLVGADIPDLVTAKPYLALVELEVLQIEIVDIMAALPLGTVYTVVQVS